MTSEYKVILSWETWQYKNIDEQMGYGSNHMPQKPEPSLHGVRTRDN